MAPIKAIINGTSITAEEGQTILSAALAAGIYIPYLCSHPDLTSQGGCKLCTVELSRGDSTELVTSCNTVIEDGMQIVTKTDEIDELRTTSLELIMADHPKDCTGCRSYLNCELQALMQYIPVTGVRMRPIRRNTLGINTDNPLIDREMERCIQCGRCIRVCKDVRCVDAYQVNRKGYETYVGTKDDKPLAETDCRFCSACVEVCPTGALQDREGVFRQDLQRDLALVPCKAECPAQTDVPRYVRLIKEGRYTEAVGVLRERLTFPHTLGFVCRAYCEGGCKRVGLDETVSIRDLKRYACEQDNEKTWSERFTHRPSTGRKVAVVGGGPAGLTAAFYLQKQGHAVTVFEKKPRLGGMLTYAIPEFRLPRDVVDEEIDFILSSGVKSVTGTEVKDANSLKQEGFSAVLLAVGACKGKLPSYDGIDAEGIYTALDFLEMSLTGDGLSSIPEDARVIVIGSGNVAFDVARTAIRRTKQVSLVCRRPVETIQAEPEEIKLSQQEGVVLYPSKAISSIEVQDGSVKGLCVHDARADEQLQNSAAPSSREGNIDLVCDILVFATGQECAIDERLGIDLDTQGWPVVSEFACSISGVFAAGDAVTGTQSIVEAVAAGRQAAEMIDLYLGGDGDVSDVLVDKEAPDPCIGVIEDFSHIDRAEAMLDDEKPVEGNYEIVNLGLCPGDVHTECERCLQCDLRGGITRPTLWNAYTQ